MSEMYTASRIAVWGRCQRAHHYRYTLGIRTPSGPAAEFGTHTHGALEAWYRAWQTWDGSADDPRLDAAFAAIDIADTDDLNRARLRALIAAYHVRWGSEPWTVIAVEVEFRYWLTYKDETGADIPVEVGGKIDAIIRDADGRYWIVEHKSSTQDTSAGSPYWAKLAIDTQISIYVDGAAYGLDTEVAGAIYDVLKRPTHDLLKATPADKRRMTLGKGCRKCGGSGGGKEGVVQGRGHLIVNFGSVVEHPPCADCKETGWKCDAEGVPQTPHLDARQRETDETIDEFADRIADELASKPDDYLSRGVVVRLDSELPKMRADLIETVRSMRALAALELHPPSFGACSMGREMCGFFTACSGQQSIDDHDVFPRGDSHPELTNRAA